MSSANSNSCTSSCSNLVPYLYFLLNCSGQDFPGLYLKRLKGSRPASVGWVGRKWAWSDHSHSWSLLPHQRHCWRQFLPSSTLCSDGSQLVLTQSPVVIWKMTAPLSCYLLRCIHLWSPSKAAVQSGWVLGGLACQQPDSCLSLCWGGLRPSPAFLLSTILKHATILAILLAVLKLEFCPSVSLENCWLYPLVCVVQSLVSDHRWSHCPVPSGLHMISASISFMVSSITKKTPQMDSQRGWWFPLRWPEALRRHGMDAVMYKYPSQQVGM